MDDHSKSCMGHGRLLDRLLGCRPHDAMGGAMTPYIAVLVYFTVGFVLVVKWVHEEQSLPAADRAGSLGCIISVIIWPFIVAYRFWS